MELSELEGLVRLELDGNHLTGVRRMHACMNTCTRDMYIYLAYEGRNKKALVGGALLGSICVVDGGAGGQGTSPRCFPPRLGR